MKNFWTLYTFNYKNFMKIKLLQIATAMLLVGIGGALYFNGQASEGKTVDLYVRNTTNVASSLLNERLNTINAQTGSKDTYAFKTVNNEETSYPQVIITEAANVYNIEFVYDDVRDMDRGMQERFTATFKTFVQTQPDNVTSSQTFNHTEGAPLFILGYITMMLSYALISLFAGNLMNSIVTDKLQKRMDVLAYKTRPTTLIFSKIFAMLTIALQMILLVVLEITAFVQFELVSREWFDQFLNGLTIDYGVAVLVGLFVLLGSFVYMLLFSMFGIFVSSEEQESTAPLPGIMVLMFALWFSIYAISDMNGPFLQYSLYVPIVSPFTLPAVVFSGQYDYLQLLLVAGSFAAFIGIATWVINKVILPRKMS